MKFCLQLLFLLSVILISAKSQSCGNGNKLIHLGISRMAADKIADMHNRYRLKIAKGQVYGQPMGTNLLRMTYDIPLEEKARDVSMTCEFKHLVVSDDRWKHVGQNLYMEYVSEPDQTQNWEVAIKAWFDEVKYYNYSNGFSRDTMHYTQLMWSDTYKVGCDFVMFFDKANSMFAKLYTCNYGPGGNIVGQYPYAVDDSSECHNLC